MKDPFNIFNKLVNHGLQYLGTIGLSEKDDRHLSLKHENYTHRHASQTPQDYKIHRTNNHVVAMIPYPYGAKVTETVSRSDGSDDTVQATGTIYNQTALRASIQDKKVHGYDTTNEDVILAALENATEKAGLTNEMNASHIMGFFTGDFEAAMIYTNKIPLKPAATQYSIPMKGYH